MARRIELEKDLQSVLGAFLKTEKGMEWACYMIAELFGIVPGARGHASFVAELKLARPSKRKAVPCGDGTARPDEAPARPDEAPARPDPATGVRRRASGGGVPSLAWAAVEPHQVEALRRAWYGGRAVVHKISDMAAGIKPFDMVYLSGDVPAVLIVGYGDGDGGLYGVYALSIMDVDAWYGLGGGRGSGMTMEYAKRHGVSVPFG